MLPFAEAHEVLALALLHLLRLRAMEGDFCRSASFVTGWARPTLGSASAAHALCCLWSAHAALDLLNSGPPTQHYATQGLALPPCCAPPCRNQPSTAAYLQNSVQLMPPGPRSECLKRPLRPAAARRGQKQAGFWVAGAPRSTPLQYLKSEVSRFRLLSYAQQLLTHAPLHYRKRGLLAKALQAAQAVRRGATRAVQPTRACAAQCTCCTANRWALQLCRCSLNDHHRLVHKVSRVRAALVVREALLVDGKVKLGGQLGDHVLRLERGGSERFESKAPGQRKQASYNPWHRGRMGHRPTAQDRSPVVRLAGR